MGGFVSSELCVLWRKVMGRGEGKVGDGRGRDRESRREVLPARAGRQVEGMHT
jgi:hypothetical protein